MDDISKIKRLPVEKLIKIYNNCYEPEILEIIVERNRGLVYKIARRFTSRRNSFDDIVQVAFTGLLVAINRFDFKQETKFSTFAFYYIKGEIQHFLRDNNLVRIPRWLYKLNNLFDIYVNKFESENGRYPTKSEISSGMNISIESIDEIMKSREATFYNYYKDDSFQEIYTHFDKKVIKSKTPKSFELVMEDKILLWEAVDRLKELNKKVIILKYFLGLSQEEIGKEMGISQRTVSRKINDSIKLLRENIV